MSDYTITLKRISEVYGEDQVKLWFKSYTMQRYLTLEQVTEISNAGIFDMDFLADLIFRHYYFREIAYETPEMFKHYAITKMREIMGTYAPLIYSVSLAYNPFEDKNISIKETFSKNKVGTKDSTNVEATSRNLSLENTATGSNSTTGASASTSENNASSLNVTSDTPQGQISKEEILQGKYASSTSANESESKITDSTSSTSRGSQETQDKGTEAEAINNQGSKTLNENEVETYEKLKEGRETGKTKSELLFEYRKNIMNIYEKIIDDLNPLFFALF